MEKKVVITVTDGEVYVDFVGFSSVFEENGLLQAILAHRLSKDSYGNGEKKTDEVESLQL